VQHLGRADAVDDLDAKVGGESLAQLAGQGLAGGRGQPQGHVFLLAAGRGQQPAKPVRRAEEHGRALAADFTAPTLEGGVGRGPFGIRIVVAPTLRGKLSALPSRRQRTAWPREADVALADTKDRRAVQLAVQYGGVAVQGALGRPVEPEE